MHPEVITPRSRHLLKALGRLDLIRRFYLAGGTALALQYGHRKSIDFDFFSEKDFFPENLKKELSQIGSLRILTEEEDTLTVILDGSSISFFKYTNRLLFPLIKYQGISIADRRDIACMKINAIAGRGGKKDFIDLYFLLKDYALIELLKLFTKKYQGLDYNQAHILKSLTYFKDTDQEPMPRMIKKVNWLTVKKELIKRAKSHVL